jgi:hypothetical protein
MKKTPKLIAEQEVCNQVIDLDLLAPTVEAAMDTLGVERIEAVADRGYFKIEDIEACEQAGATAYVPRPIRGLAVNQGYFAKELFRYDPAEDVYVCPAGATLYPRYEGKLRGNRKIEYCDRAACKTSALKPRCTGNLTAGSRVWRTRRSLTAWPLVSTPGQTFSTCGARASSIPSAPSSSG